MQHLGFHSVFARLFASVMLALILFAVAMVLLTQLVHDKDAGIRSEVVATQILGQIDPFLQELNVSVSKNNRLQSRFMLAVVKKSFDIFDESLQAKMGLYDHDGHLVMQTDNSDMPPELPAMPSLLSRVFPSFADTTPTQQAQVYSSTGYTLLYESRLAPKKPVLSAALNLFTGTLLLLLIMAGVLWWIARSMTWRINQMSRQMTQLGDGDFTVRVNARGNDEIALLARGFNQAAQKIEHLIEANNLLLAHASHELRTPITRIRLQIEMMDMLASSMTTDTKAKFDKRAQAINRDLSGLNDLVESILLVSRLDAGHVLQQIERMDLYDLVNQERQHYPEATLIGEHIVIEGQPLMLTHLIRNLLNNAVLHGEPPVTLLLYGVQNKAEADTIPDYLLQSVVGSSLTDYNSADYNHYDESLIEGEHYEINEQGQRISILSDNLTSNNDAQSVNKSKSDTTELSTALLLPAPPLYKNGETFIVDNLTTDDLLANDSDEINPNEATDSPMTIDLSAMDTNQELSHAPQNSLDGALDKTFSTATSFINTNALFSNYNKFTTDLIDKIKKVSWRAVPNIEEPVAGQRQAKQTAVSHKNKSIHTQTKTNMKNNSDPSINNNETPAAQRKESLFKKHLKRAKPEPTRPLPNYAVLAVIDEGCGIPEDKREEIFSPFVRLQQKKKGSGLGLSLVTQIVTAHQGHITTDTINGHTRFLIVLPVKHDPHYNYRDHKRRG
ncbi:sensor histidine kinase [Psychrobacter frigidicola]|uniref:histidine kinase n=1 Tax=Psychrobacter frigidicola TaxID=45611 RepID=A0A5C7A1N2_9GAMM|nr:sensor histidine kinase [Psychrobacter frigidicola]TXD96394.1 sensor histidine kinase [Psychrobacter frigidicola]